LVEPSDDDPRWVLVVDPIDGTRPAMAGFEAACVSVALAELGDGAPTMGDVVAGSVVELKSGRTFYAERGGGLDPAPSLSANRDLDRLFWAYGLRGRPMRAIAEVIGELIDASSVGGGTFDLGSASYDMTRSQSAMTFTSSPARGWSPTSRGCASARAARRGGCSTTVPTTRRGRPRLEEVGP
jgi:fructose-1,6-bisphosphatase/inositol monophosphatase family enzyme